MVIILRLCGLWMIIGYTILAFLAGQGIQIGTEPQIIGVVCFGLAAILDRQRSIEAARAEDRKTLVLIARKLQIPVPYPAEQTSWNSE